MSKVILDLFYSLGDDNTQIRVEAAKNLIQTLIKQDSQDDWNYAFERLLKGLSSSRGSARLGYSMALAEVLNTRKDHITLTRYLDCMNDYFTTTKNAKGYEERGMFFGSLFALQSLAQSPLLGLKSTSEQEIERFIDYVIVLACKKPWLREPSFAILCDLIERAHRNKHVFPILRSSSGSDLLEYIIQNMQDQGLILTTEMVALYVTLDQESRSVIRDKLQSFGWKNGNPLSRGNLITLSKVVKELVADNYESQTNEDEKTGKGQKKKQHQTNWRPSLHLVWSKLSTELLEDHESTKRDEKPSKKKQKKSSSKASDEATGQSRIQLEEFWKMIIDEGFFASSSSPERKFWGFEIFNLFFRHAGQQTVAVLFSPNLLRCLINQSAQQDRLLNKQAKSILAAITEVCDARRDLAFPIVEQLLNGKNGSLNFDRLTKSKTTEQLLSVVPNSETRKVVRFYTDLFITVPKEQSTREKKKKEELEPAIDKTESLCNSRRQWALDQLLNIVKNGVKDIKLVQNNNAEGNHYDIKWLENIIELLIKCGYFKNAIEGVPKFTEHTRGVCQSRMNSIITATVELKRPDGASWAYYALKFLTNLEKQEDWELLVGFEGDLLKAKDKAIKTVEKLHKKRQSSPHVSINSQLEAFELLFSLVLIQVYSSDVEAALVLNELQVCYSKIFGKAKIEEGQGADDAENMDATQILTEILLSFLTRKSTLFRKLSEMIWETFASQVTAGSLTLLYDVLDKKESLAGQEDLFDQTDDEAGEESDYEEEGEEDEDADMSGQESESLAGSDLESELEEDSDEQIDAADEEARLALAATLGITDVDVNGDFDEKGDKEEKEEEDDDDESSMDDEGMMALDETLANIFRERKRMLSESKSKSTKKNEAKEARQNIIQFKLRILDLISIYIKQQPANVLVLSCLRPLLSLINSTKDRQVGEKSHQLVKSLCRSKTLPSVDETGVDLVEILEDIHQQAQKSSNKAHSTACSQASVFVCKILMHKKKDGYIDTIGQVYCTSLTAWMKNKSSKVTPQLFFDLVNFISSIHQNKEIPKPKKNE